MKALKVLSNCANRSAYIYFETDIKKTNFIFTDSGIGIDNVLMPWTILRFNSSHKKDKKYLFGSFGQGGFTVCKYSKYTIIITNLYNKTSFTIIRLNSKECKYQYLVDTQSKDERYKKQIDDQSEGNFLPPCINQYKLFGTSVMYIGYDFYNLPEENFFNSFLTYRLTLLIKKENKYRPMKGLKSRLENLVIKEEAEKNSATTFNLNDKEKAKIIYYYLKDKKINSYLSDARRHSVFITYNGQTHTRLRKGLISESNLSKLIDKMIIEVNCNQLSYNLRTTLFDSSRQKIEQKYEKILENSIKYFLSNDEFLKGEQLRLEEEDRRKEISADTEFYRQELAEMIEDYSPGKYSVSKSGDDSKIRLLYTSTYFKIAVQKNDIDVLISKKCYLKLEANITDKSFISGEYYIGYDSDCCYKLNFQIPKLSEGTAVAVLSFNGVKVGDKISIKFFLKSENQSISLETDTKHINIVEEKILDDIDLLDNPTYFKIKNSENDINAVIGKKYHLTLESDITDRSFTANRCYVEFDKRVKGVDYQISSLKKGRGVATLSFPEAKIRDKFPIKFF